RLNIRAMVLTAADGFSMWGSTRRAARPCTRAADQRRAGGGLHCQGIVPFLIWRHPVKLESDGHSPQYADSTVTRSIHESPRIPGTSDPPSRRAARAAV